MRVQVSINLNNTIDTVLDLQELSPPVESNVSNGSNVFEETTLPGYKGFQLSDNYKAAPSTLDGTYRFFKDEGYPGYLSGTLSARAKGFLVSENHYKYSAILDGNSTFFADGLARKPVEFAYQFPQVLAFSFYLKGTIPENLYLSFDTATGEYAKNFDIVCAPRIIRIKDNTSPIISVSLKDLQIQESEKAQVIIIAFYDWSAPSKSLQITSISPYYTRTYTGTDLISVTCSENLFDAQMKIAPGIVEQYADVSIYDRDGMLHELAANDELVNDHKVRIVAIDDSTDTTYELGTYTVTSWDIGNEDASVGVTCQDRSYVLDKINIASIPIKTRTVDDMLKLMFGYANNAPWQYIDSDTEFYCQFIITPNNWFHPGTILELLKKICALGMLRIYWHVDKYIVARCW